MKPDLRVLIVCPGLGRINRGYESFTRECFECLHGAAGLDVRLFQGGGAASANCVTLWNLPRDGALAKALGRITRRGAYFIEQFSFFLSLAPRIWKERPQVIFFSDGGLGNFLWYFRRIARLRYKLLFSNGGPLLPPFPRWDYVQQVAPVHYETALAAGQPADRMEVVPYGFRADQNLAPCGPGDRALLREQLKLPSDRPIVLSIGALNSTQKRMDYVIREVAQLSAPRPFLLLLGQEDSETPAVRALAGDLLGESGFGIRTVPASMVSEYCLASDIFVLASLSEGFGRVFVEAALGGLRCIAHDTPLTRYVLGSEGSSFVDARQEGAFASALTQALGDSPDESARQRIHTSAYERFSWDRLKKAYVQMIRKCAGAH